MADDGKVVKINDASLVLSGSAIILAIFVVGILFPSDVPVVRGLTYIIILLLMVGFLALLGKRIVGRFSGVFINERNKMTLSRFQLVVWTIIVLSAFVTIALERIQVGATDPLSIGLPIQLWELLGISTTSLVGSPLILSTKLQKKPDGPTLKRLAKRKPQVSRDLSDDDKTRLASFLADDKASLSEDDKEILAPHGILASSGSISSAKFYDMFRGDEVDNENAIDMAKVQMFFFTILIAFSYAVELIQLIMTQSLTTNMYQFPALTDSVVTLLGISTGGYLGNKTYDHTSTEKQ